MTLHRRDLVSLFFGLVFALCGLAFLNRSENWDVFESGGLLAVGLIAIGALGVVLVLAGARSGRPSQPDSLDPSATASGPDATPGHLTDDLDSGDLDLPGFDDPYGPDEPPT